MTATSAALVVPRGLSWTLIGTFVNAACQWLAIITVTRLGTPEILGHYSYALAVCAPLVRGAVSVMRRPVVLTLIRHPRMIPVDATHTRTNRSPAMPALALATMVRGVEAAIAAAAAHATDIKAAEGTLD